MLLTKFRCFSPQLAPTRNILTTSVQRNFSFVTLAKNMETRKKFFKKINDYNRKVSLQVLPIHKRVYENLKYHKKKTLFFIFVLGLMAYWDTYSKIIKNIRTMEPFRLKLRRWILGEERWIPDSITETWIAEEGFRLKPETITVLSELFTKTDKEFAYGVDRKFLKKIYVKAGCLETKKDKEDFYNEGPYRRKLNQRVCGVSLKLFLLVFEKMFRKLQKKDPSLTEEEFLRRIVEAWNEAKTKTLQWEQKILRIRPELRKAGSVAEEDKLRVLWDKVKENPTIPFEEIEKTLADYGFYGMSLKEKLLVLQYQVMNFEVTRAYYASKLEKEVIVGKMNKLQGKIKDLDDKIQRYKDLIATNRVQFKEIFQKPKEAENSKENPEGNTEEKKEGEYKS